jgi:hypothetical protein
MAKSLPLTAAALGSLFVIAFQLQLLPFFSPLFVDDRLFWPTIYYGVWSLVIGLTLAILATQRPVLHRSLPVLLVCAFAAGLTLIHPIDGIAKNFLVAMMFVACTTVLAIASAPLALLRFSASATVLSAVICLLDILFAHGLTNSVGRAAGLSVNANVAAEGLLLGAASSYWAVPQRLRGSFLLIVGAAVFVTLSRSTSLAAIVICTGVGADLLWTRLKSPGPHPRIRWVRLAALTLGLAGWIVTALVSNDRFSVAAGDSYRQIGTALTAFGEARRSIATTVESRLPALSQITTPNRNTTSLNGDAETKSETDEMMQEIARSAENEGDINSISARGLLIELAFRSYQGGPFLGQGLGAAHAIHPHNTFLLFAVAFGELGWLVPIAFLGLTVYWIRSIRQLPLFLATFTVMMTSHDILLTPGLLAPIVFGVAGLNSLRYRANDAPDTSSAMKYIAVAAPILFALGVATAGIGTSSVAVAPKLLLLLVFSAISLWSIAVWLWYEKPVPQPENALPRGHRWD